MGHPYNEKGSCRDYVYNGKLTKDCMCSVCRSHDEYSDQMLCKMEDNGNFDVMGVCHQIHGTLSQPTQDRRADESSSLGRRGRKRRATVKMEKERYEPMEQPKSSGKKR